MFYAKKDKGYWNTQGVDADKYCANHVRSGDGYKCLGHKKNTMMRQADDYADASAMIANSEQARHIKEQKY
jgi:hypothetical protein